MEGTTATRRRGRPRLYADAAARQRACRARKGPGLHQRLAALTEENQTLSARLAAAHERAQELEERRSPRQLERLMVQLEAERRKQAALRQELTDVKLDRQSLKASYRDLQKAFNRVTNLRRSWNPAAATDGHLTAKRVDDELRRLLAVCHPDKWQDHPVATELSKAVGELRERLKRDA